MGGGEFSFDGCKCHSNPDCEDDENDDVPVAGERWDKNCCEESGRVEEHIRDGVKCASPWAVQVESSCDESVKDIGKSAQNKCANKESFVSCRCRVG